MAFKIFSETSTRVMVIPMTLPPPHLNHLVTGVGAESPWVKSRGGFIEMMYWLKGIQMQENRYFSFKRVFGDLRPKYNANKK